MKRTTVFIVSLIAFCTTLLSLACAGGIPVIDSANITQSITNSMKQIAEMGKQLTQLQNQYNQMVSQYQSMTQGRGLGNFENNKAFKNYLPDDWKSSYDRINSGGYTGLTSSGQSVRNSNQKYDICKNMTSDIKKVCERQAALAYQQRANGADAYEKARARLDQIEKLMKKAGETKDQKEILELNARIQAEQAMINNESVKLQMYAMIADGEKQLAERQLKELAAKELSNKGGVTLESNGMNLGW
jgi:type IV secretion system protein VirB5